MGSVRAKRENVCRRCDVVADRQCKRCEHLSCVDHQPHPRLCLGCHAEYVQRRSELDTEPRRQTTLSRAIPSALILLLLGFAVAKLIVRFRGQPSPADFLFVWIPLAFAGGLLVMWIGELLEGAREAQRCARFIDERPVHRNRRRRPRPSTQL